MEQLLLAQAAATPAHPGEEPIPMEVDEPIPIQGNQPADEPMAAGDSEDEESLPKGLMNSAFVLKSAFTSIVEVDGMYDKPSSLLPSEACMQRIQALYIPMKDWVGQVRQRENILSKAQVDGGKDLVVGSHNWIAHKLAESNYIHNISCTRISRHAAWTFNLEKVEKIYRAQHAGLLNFQVPTHFTPGCVMDANMERSYQVVAYGPREAMVLAVVEEVFRGANTKVSAKAKAKAKAKAANTRLMKVTKPVTFPLKTSHTCRLKVTILQPATADATWQATVIGSHEVIDPLDPDIGVVQEFKVESVTQKWPILMLKLPSDTIPTMLALQQHFRNEDADLPALPAPGDPDAGALPSVLPKAAGAALGKAKGRPRKSIFECFSATIVN